MRAIYYFMHQKIGHSSFAITSCWVSTAKTSHRRFQVQTSLNPKPISSPITATKHTIINHPPTPHQPPSTTATLHFSFITSISSPSPPPPPPPPPPPHFTINTTTITNHSPPPQQQPPFEITAHKTCRRQNHRN
ncbi:hypothetical protein RND81_14G020100 [Saponaria officinalis]|uniref:Uncharacterized protein n=1 Tax=Saponaria officinalis TaxID=3572 RepID=A0AAW1GP86_SAPOF